MRDAGPNVDSDFDERVLGLGSNDYTGYCVQCAHAWRQALPLHRITTFIDYATIGLCITDQMGCAARGLSIVGYDTWKPAR